MVPERNSSVEHHVDLEELRPLNKLKGSITIVIHHSEKNTFVKDDAVREGGYISHKKDLTRVRFEFRHNKYENAGGYDHEEELLGSLQPHVNLEVLEFNGYRGTRMPRWAKDDNLATFLPNLVRLHLEDCPEIQCLPSLDKMNQLSSLVLIKLLNLEYINYNQHATASRPESISEKVASVFLCLEKLYLKWLPKLKEWHHRPQERVGGDNSSSSSNHEPCQRSLYLPKLKSLVVIDCLELILISHCPILEVLTLRRFNERLRIETKPTSFPKLTMVNIDNMAWLHSSLPEDSLHSLIDLSLAYDKEVVSLAGFGKVFRACSSSLRALGIINCPKLKSVSGVLGNLTALKRLNLYELPIENLEDEENNDMTWESLGGTLSVLRIHQCPKLKSFPKWMQKLTSLRQLEITTCSSELNKRCENPNGEDWPNIKHIPTIVVKENPLARSGQFGRLVFHRTE